LLPEPSRRPEPGPLSILDTTLCWRYRCAGCFRPATAGTPVAEVRVSHLPGPGVKPLMSEQRVGLWLIGACGGVGTTAALGLSALARGLIDGTSLVTALPTFDALDLDRPP